MSVAKKTISLPAQMYDDALARSKRLRYDSFSEYIQHLIEKDLTERPQHLIVREEAPELAAREGPTAAHEETLRRAIEKARPNPRRVS